MSSPSIRSESGYFYDYFFRELRKNIRRRGVKLWALELFYEIFYKLKYPKFKDLYKISPKDLGFDEREQKNSVQYETLNYYMLLKCFQRLKFHLASFEHAVFTDIGSGAGRILHIAQTRGFQNLLGIELSGELCELCKKNAEIHLPGEAKLEIVNQNIRDVDFKTLINRFPQTEQETLVFFLNNPFSDEVLQVFMDKLDVLRGHDIYMIYVWKQYKETVMEKGFEILHEEMIKGRFTLDSFRIYYRKKPPQNA